LFTLVGCFYADCKFLEKGSDNNGSCVEFWQSKGALDAIRGLPGRGHCPFGYLGSGERSGCYGWRAVWDGGAHLCLAKGENNVKKREKERRREGEKERRREGEKGTLLREDSFAGEGGAGDEGGHRYTEDAVEVQVLAGEKEVGDGCLGGKNCPERVAPVFGYAV